MSFLRTIITLLSVLGGWATSTHGIHALTEDDRAGSRNVSLRLFAELEELARIVDIAYCVSLTGTGIQQPFQCLSRCSDFEDFELISTWNTGPLLSDSCGYIAVSHQPAVPRIIVAFRGTYSIANTVVDLSTIPQEYVPYPSGPSDGSEMRGMIDYRHARDKSSLLDATSPHCHNCTVHSGFYRSWLNTRAVILQKLEQCLKAYPSYQLTLVGHSLGGAVAALAALDLITRGWRPQVTTFGEPRLGNEALTQYIDKVFGLNKKPEESKEPRLCFHRVTHAGDPVPLLPLKEWGYRMHGGEIFITKSNLYPSLADLRRCHGDEDVSCIAGEETFATRAAESLSRGGNVASSLQAPLKAVGGRKTKWLGDDGGKWAIPARFRLWQLFFAHRDYFWRLGLCVPGGDPGPYS